MQNKKIKVLIGDSLGCEEERETQILLKILVLGNYEVEQSMTRPLAEVVQHMRDKKSDGSRLNRMDF